MDIPGGGFVAMDPRCHDDKLLAWAGRTGLPVLALNYRKAPEHPYPYALNECYDAYHTLVTSRGRCIGLAGTMVPKIVLSGDSAGGNLAVGTILMLLQSSPHSTYDPAYRTTQLSLPLPEALVSVYPALDVNIGNWMTDEQMALIRIPERKRTNRGVLRRKSDDYRKLTPDTPHGSDDEDESRLKMKPPSPRRNTSTSGHLLSDQPMTESPVTANPNEPFTSAAHTIDAKRKAKTSLINAQTPQPLRTRLAMSSMISYFNDRILSPEMLRAMIILYIGPYNKPDFSTDFLLSPLLAPEALLARFPKVYMLTGERDPLVDDTVIFAGRLRQAKLQRFRERQELGLESSSARFREEDHVEVMLIPGISHGFLQFVSVFPEGWKYILQCSRWMREVFRAADERDATAPPTPAEGLDGDYFSHIKERHHRRQGSQSDNEDRPLEMSSLSLTSSHDQGRRKGSTVMAKAGAERASVSGRGSIKKSSSGRNFSGRMSPIATRKSLVRLASHEDLLGRRMHGLTGGLMGGELVPDTP